VGLSTVVLSRRGSRKQSPSRLLRVDWGQTAAHRRCDDLKRRGTDLGGVEMGYTTRYLLSKMLRTWTNFIYLLLPKHTMLFSSALRIF
jgi:glucose-6-phosphate dehydrogenase assembly protein OpcA